ncbi:MAG: hypothetical protein NTZ74_02885 [Chloroflexi bacterium]|nr:hypothetical protein [Chloroflexota bacterium]
MNMVNIKIRLAGIQDLDKLTDLHCASFKPEDHVPMMFGRDYAKATYRWLVTNKSSYTLVADINGNIAGLVATCDRSFTTPMFFACLPEFVVSLVRSPSLIFNSKLWKRLFRRPDITGYNSKIIVNHPDVAQMTIGAVDTSYRGMNIFPQLISATKEYSKKRRTRAIRAGVYKTNAPCRRAFIKDNWTETPELETSDTVFYMAFLDDSIQNELDLGYLAI